MALKEGREWSAAVRRGEANNGVVLRPAVGNACGGFSFWRGDVSRGWGRLASRRDESVGDDGGDGE